ncbi:hypothetical protein ABKN59_009454 [Abortiporus biennis]
MSQTPLLPAPPAADEDSVTWKVEVDETQPVKFDSLGPMVVNSDGTLSRIANWANMTELERERTMRVLAARNKIRLAEQERKQQAEGTLETSETSVPE